VSSFRRASFCICKSGFERAAALVLLLSLNDTNTTALAFIVVDDGDGQK